jgi:hypothetical protein
MLTVNRLGLPAKLRRSLACTNSIENMMGEEAMAKCCNGAALDAAGMMEAANGFRRLKAHKQLP